MNDEITIFPVYLREGVAAMLHLPNNLTRAEAEKICAVVRALAYDTKKIETSEPANDE